MYEETKWEGGIFYIKSTPDGEWRRAGEARQKAEVKALMEENERLREALGGLVNMLSVSPESDTEPLFKKARAALQDKSSGV